MTQAQSVEDYFRRCDKADWFYQYSDDSLVYRAGAAELESIKTDSNLSPQHKAIYDAFKAYNVAPLTNSRPTWDAMQGALSPRRLSSVDLVVKTRNSTYVFSVGSYSTTVTCTEGTFQGEVVLAEALFSTDEVLEAAHKAMYFDFAEANSEVEHLVGHHLHFRADGRRIETSTVRKAVWTVEALFS